MKKLIITAVCFIFCIVSYSQNSENTSLFYFRDVFLESLSITDDAFPGIPAEVGYIEYCDSSYRENGHIYKLYRVTRPDGSIVNASERFPEGKLLPPSKRQTFFIIEKGPDGSKRCRRVVSETSHLHYEGGSFFWKKNTATC